MSVDLISPYRILAFGFAVTIAGISPGSAIADANTPTDQSDMMSVDPPDTNAYAFYSQTGPYSGLEWDFERNSILMNGR